MSVRLVAPALVFHDTTFHPIVRAAQPWLSAAEIAAALGYSRSDTISRLYRQHAAEFTEHMTAVVSGNTESVFPVEQRIFSLRGAHLIGMFARTERASEFRRWVLDILDREAGDPQPPVVPSMIGRRWLLSIDHTGAERVTPVPDDACVMTQSRMLQALVEPNGLIVENDELAEFIIAAVRRLQHRLKYHAAQSKANGMKQGRGK